MTAGSVAADALVHERFARTETTLASFIDVEVDRLAQACLEMARRFQQGGRLIVFAEGAEASDAAHVAVEFVHPVLVGKRALPAIALTNDSASLTGVIRSDGQGFVAMLEVLARPLDIALALSRDRGSESVRGALERATALGLLTVHLSGGFSEPPTNAGFSLHVPSDDAMVVQEVHETAYHVLWELVHVFFENRVV